jgi:hypothetical protein
MVRRITILLIFAALSAHAEKIILNNSAILNGVFSGSTRRKVIDLGDYAELTRFQLAGGVLPSFGAYPALYDEATRTSIRITGTVQQAVTEWSAMDNARRPAKVELETFLGGLTPKQFRQALRAAYRNIATNTAFNATQRGLLTNFAWAVQAEDDWADLRDEKQAEDIKLNITKEDAP